MITYSDDTVFNVKASAIINTVNCVGRAGSGIALECSVRFPKMFEKYKEQCELSKVKVGELQIYYENNIKIINFPTKDDSKKPASINYIIDGLDYFREHYKEYACDTFAFPPLGCTSGKLNLEDVLPIMEEKLQDLDANIIICLDRNGPDEAEQKMLNAIKKIDLDFLKMELDLTSDDANNLKRNLSKVTRFGKIRNREIIWSSETYRKIYNYIKQNADRILNS